LGSRAPALSCAARNSLESRRWISWPRPKPWRIEQLAAMEIVRVPELRSVQRSDARARTRTSRGAVEGAAVMIDGSASIEAAAPCARGPVTSVQFPEGLGQISIRTEKFWGEHPSGALPGRGARSTRDDAATRWPQWAGTARGVPYVRA